MPTGSLLLFSVELISSTENQGIDANDKCLIAKL
jgi:hypothetical protein